MRDISCKLLSTTLITDSIGVQKEKIEEVEIPIIKVEDIYNTGSKDIYVVKDELGKQVLLPGIDEVIKEVKLDDRIIVHLIPGLI